MPSTPSIRISQHQRFQGPPTYPPYSAAASPIPMAISRTRESAPPPLPPPTYIPEIAAGQDPGWQWGNDPSGADFGRPASVKPGSSLLGGVGRSMTRQGKEHESAVYHARSDGRRGSSISTVTQSHEHDMPEDSMNYHSNEDIASSRPNSNGLQSERQLEQWTLEESSQSYDKQLLSRIGGPNTPTRGSLSYPDNQLAPTEFERRNSSLRPLSVPERRHASIDSTHGPRWPTSGAVSPGYTGFWHDQNPSECNRTNAAQRSSVQFEDLGTQGSYDHSVFVNDDFAMEEGPMSNLNIHDRSPGSPKAGSKRRASSPPRERDDRSSISSASGPNEIYHRRSMQQLPNRSSPVSRFHPNHSSISSASSFGPRHGSLGSSLGMASVPSSATSYASGRVSPGALSPAVDTDPASGTPYGGAKGLEPSPHMTQQQRTEPESNQSGARRPSTESVAHSRNGSLSHIQGIYICECCPKKPKKFDAQEELRQHESEKQYMCHYCPNRFKNKNEAERHQNSLHLRKHSWSCAKLSGIEAAYHSSSSNNIDVCGYCGEEFPNPPQWDIRAEHLNHIHKFSECNQAKKFFRADHFRQHLKHSHQGTSGKWTNMLENACMKDEPPPEKRMSPVAVAVSGGQAPPALMVTTSGLNVSDQGSETLEETPHDS
ncbi:hypothetical protein LTR37_012598 [Vermiconidia calcicola]|uniref:Uncharacterized protein n=1 Tax=Vermiconidia calcicola TaxID=1690605 RepID=A0ACC3MZH7_9PEZI|nr:hypothetical protein LTR37_012598 [Vermiconidia calcicola]